MFCLHSKDILLDHQDIELLDHNIKDEDKINMSNLWPTITQYMPWLNNIIRLIFKLNYASFVTSSSTEQNYGSWTSNVIIPPDLTNDKKEPYIRNIDLWRHNFSTSKKSRLVRPSSNLLLYRTSKHNILDNSSRWIMKSRFVMLT